MFFLFPDLPKRVDTKKTVLTFIGAHMRLEIMQAVRHNSGHMGDICIKWLIDSHRARRRTSEEVEVLFTGTAERNRRGFDWQRPSILMQLKKKVNLICSSTLWMIRSASNMQMWRLSRDEISHGYLFDKEQSRSAVRWPEALPHILALSKKLFRTETQVSHSVTHRGQKEC